MTFQSFTRCVCVRVRVRTCEQGLPRLGGEGWKEAVINMKYNVNNVSKLFARNVCTVLSRCS